MRHRKDGRHLSLATAPRKSLLRNLATDLFRHERVTTTEARAKEVRRYAERLITLAKRTDLHARRQLMAEIHDKEVGQKLFDSLSQRYLDRPGGYTRILKLAPRRGDGAPMAILELVDNQVLQQKRSAKEAKAQVKPRKREGEEGGGS